MPAKFDCCVLLPRRFEQLGLLNINQDLLLWRLPLLLWRLPLLRVNQAGQGS